jgi:hypothetical protein
MEPSRDLTAEVIAIKRKRYEEKMEKEYKAKVLGMLEVLPEEKFI